MGEHDIEELAARVANKLVDMFRGAPHICIRTDEIARMQAKEDTLIASHAKMCDKLDTIMTMLLKAKTDKNIIVATIGAVGVAVGTAIPLVVPWLIAFFSKIL